MAVLEPVEWEEAWWHGTQKFDVPRVLLIGDSISVGYRDIVGRMMSGKAVVNTLSTSKSIDNPYFQTTIGLVFAQMRQCDLIHFNNGNHGFHLSKEDYEYYYEAMISYLLTLRPSDRIILALCTAILRGNDDETYVKKRNEVVCKLADKYKLSVDDLYPVVENKPEYRCEDGLHFTNDGYVLLAQKVTEEISKKLGI